MSLALLSIVVADTHLANHGHPPFTPAVGTDGTVYFGGTSKLYSCNGTDGTIEWTYETDQLIFASPTLGDDGTVFVGDVTGSFYALHGDGTLKWKYETGAGIFSSALVSADGTIYFGSYDFCLYALNGDGTLKWKYNFGSAVFSSPAFGADMNTIYIGGGPAMPGSSGQSNVFALTSEGKLIWNYTLSAVVESSPVIGGDGAIYFASEDTKFYALNPNGTLQWVYATGAPVGLRHEERTSPALGIEGTIYLGGQDSVLYALNADGTLKWKHQFGNAISTPGVGSDGTVYAGEKGSVGSGPDSYLHALDGTDGTLKWTYGLHHQGGLVIGPATVAADSSVVYAVSGGDALFALSANGTHLWTVPKEPKPPPPTKPFKPATNCAPACGTKSLCCQDPDAPPPGTCFSVANCSSLLGGTLVASRLQVPRLGKAVRI